MADVLQTFDNREIAIGVWMALLLLFCLFHARIRSSLADVAVAATARPLVVVLIFIIAYHAAVTLRDFGVPIAYGIFCIPLMFLLAVYSAYEDAFVRLQFVIKDESLHGFAKRRLLASFGLDFRAVSRWLRSAWSNTLESRADIVRSIEAVKSADRAA